MDLLTTTGVVLPPRGRALPLGLGLSAVVHAVTAALLLTIPGRNFVADDRPIEVAVDVIADLPPPPEASAAPSLSLSAPAIQGEPQPRPRETRRASRLRVPEPERAPSPSANAGAETPEPTEAPPAAGASADNSTTADAVETAGTGSTAAAPGSTVVPSGGLRGSGAAVVAAGDAGLVTQRRATVDRYRTQAMGTRIREVFRYPSEARDLELAGRVLLNVSIGRDGRLLEVRLAGRCPHTILCADGLRTIRAAAPFPPIPAELGASITVEVPLTYAFALE